MHDFLLFTPLVVLVLLSWKIYFARAERLLHEWASRNRLLILESKRSRMIWAGPFRFRVNGQEIYKITAKEETTDKIKTGWIRIGSFLPTLNLKVPAEKFEVVWDGESSRP